MSVSKIVKDIVKDQPYLLEAINRGIIHFGNLSAELRPKIEEILQKKVTDSSIIMALRRYADEVQQKYDKEGNRRLYCEINMKTSICDFNVVKTPSLLQLIPSLYSLVDLNRGDFLNITVSNHEISIVVSRKHFEAFKERLKGEQILEKQSDLVALTIVFDGDFFNTPGITYQVLQSLAWKNINLLEIISTMTELTLVIDKSDSTKSYEVLHELIEKF
jgi:aspartokinase